MSDPEAKELTKWGLQSTLDGNAKFHRNCDWNLKIIQAFKHFPFYTNPLSGTDTNPVLEITTTKRNSRIDFIQSDLTKRIHVRTDPKPLPLCMKDMSNLKMNCNLCLIHILMRNIAAQIGLTRGKNIAHPPPNLALIHYSSASAYERPRSRTNRFTNRIVCLLQRTYEIQGTNFTELQSNNQRLAQPVDNIGVNSDMES
ncbi:uncharacterized protein LOC122539340 isoform X2 [Chiloscyllium plagiosum]|uniref:uncharacterized protein LOC122539340 isoform X2 n=1 Tax=Chiloscyllium plagiosum TaxID=36176 RepID=UPI001CB7FFC7|nr:uncharacterized protein LOC122539340 isoform X2 [Chiloscyllium plagiosum]